MPAKSLCQQSSSCLPRTNMCMRRVGTHIEARLELRLRERPLQRLQRCNERLNERCRQQARRQASDQHQVLCRRAAVATRKLDQLRWLGAVP